jgi:hypothetical protein
VRLAGVFDGQVVQPELLPNASQQVVAGLEQTDPDDMTGFPRPFAGLIH